MKLEVVLKYLLLLITSCSTQNFTILSHQQPITLKFKNPRFTTSIKQIPATKHNLYQSAIIFADDVNIINEIKSNLMLDNTYSKHLIFIIVFMTGDIIKSPFTDNSYLSLKSSGFSLYTYYLFPRNKSYVLITLNWFSQHFCNDPKITLINNFSMIDKKWTTELKYQRKFMNIWNCMITLETDFDDIPGVHLYYGTITGLVPEFLRIMAVHGNFTPNFQVTYRNGVLDTSTGKILSTNIYIRLGAYSIFTTGKIHFGSTFLPSEYPFYVTPGELFNSYEKLFLPFDDTTWLFILITFTVAFVVIFIVNFLPKWIKNCLYGSNVYTPAMNIIQTFFGVSQTQIPAENAPRMILIFFVFFCLVIRTAYQGISFDFLTTEMRKKPIQNIEQLVSQNFTIVTMESAGYAFDEYIYSMIGEDQKKRIQWIPDIQIVDFYRNNIKNSSAKLAFFMQDTFFDSIHFSANGIQGICLKEKLFSYPIGFGTFKNHFMNALVEETLQLVIPAGIPQYIFEHHRWLKFGIIHVNKKVGPNILSIHDLSFGFVLWAVACGLSAIVFCAELFGPYLMIVINKITGLIVFVRLLRQGILGSH